MTIPEAECGNCSVSLRWAIRPLRPHSLEIKILADDPAPAPAADPDPTPAADLDPPYLSLLAFLPCFFPFQYSDTMGIRTGQDLKMNQT